MKKYGGGQIKKICPICGDIFKLKHPNQKYCSPKCKIIARKRQIRINVDKYREIHKKEIKLKRKLEKERRKEAIDVEYQKKGIVVIEQYHTGKGTTTFGQHPNKDFKKEEILIKNELRRLKIRT